MKPLLIFIAGLAYVLCGCVPAIPVLNAAEGDDLQTVKQLLREGHSVNERDSRVKFGWTPLIAATYHRHTNMVHFLIGAGADVNLRDSDGMTALMWATGGGDESLDIVQDLIAHGADPNAKDRMGATVLSYAESSPPKPKILEVVRDAMARQQQTK